MSLTRFLPVPSDRMGILWSLLNIEDIIVVEYGTAGTTHFSVSLFDKLGIEQENRLFTTHLREEDVIMGDTSRLERALIEVDKNFNPPVIFVLASSSSAVIGTDLRGVCFEIQPKVNAKLITFAQGGFRGDYSAGINSTYQLLIDKIVEKDIPKRAGTYNILGASAGSYRCKSDVLEVERLLSEAFGMESHARLCLETSLEQVRTMGCAEVNIVLRGEALEAARVLEQKCGIPYVLGAPYGYSGTLAWLENVGSVIGKNSSAELVEKIKKSSAGAAQYKRYARMLRRDRPQALLYGDYDVVRGLGKFLRDIGITPLRQISIHNISSLEDIEPNIEYFAKEHDRIELFREAHSTLILADDSSQQVAAADNTYMRIANPVINGAQIATHLPLMGPRGADMLMESVTHYFNTLK